VDGLELFSFLLWDVVEPLAFMVIICELERIRRELARGVRKGGRD